MDKQLQQRVSLYIARLWTLFEHINVTIFIESLSWVHVYMFAKMDWSLVSSAASTIMNYV